MLKVLAQSWPLLMGVMLLMVGNGVQGTLLGVRGALEGFSTLELSIVMSAYFLGFLGGSRLTPILIRRVGHVRVFSAMGSLISAVLILYPLVLDWQAWSLMRVLIGFCFSGVYITAESWINNTATNETRGRALSAYMIVQMLGIIASQGLLAMGDPGGFGLFIIPSVMVSLAFLPLLLAKVPAPTFDRVKALGFRRLWATSPLGCVGMLLTGGIFSAMFGMASVWGALATLTLKQIAAYGAALYVGGLALQYPIGWVSDRMDRRKLIMGMSLFAAAVMAVAALVKLPFVLLLVVALLLGGMINPLYALLIAVTNDYLQKEDMAGASAGMIFLNGFGAIFGPLATGWLMGVIGKSGYFAFIGALFLALGLYAAWRISRRAGPAEHQSFTAVSPTATSLAAVAVLEQEPARPSAPGSEAA
jgi:MFS family permease